MVYLKNSICVSRFKLTKKFVIILAVGADEVDSLKSALAEAKREAEASKAAADKAARKFRRGANHPPMT